MSSWTCCSSFCVSKGACAIARCELKQNARQPLSDLIVQLLPDASSFRLACPDRAAITVLSFAFESVEHLVKALYDLAHLSSAADSQPAPWLEQIDRSHRGYEPAKRAKANSNQYRVGDHDHHHAKAEHDPLPDRDRIGHLRRR